MILHPLDNHPRPIAKERCELLPHILTLTAVKLRRLFSSGCTEPYDPLSLKEQSPLWCSDFPLPRREATAQAS